MRFFLGTHRPGFVPVGIVKAGFLLDLAAVLEDFDLAPRFVLDRLTDETDRVHILDLAARPEVSPGLAYRHIDVGPHRPFLHVAVAGSEVAQDRPYFGDIGAGFLGRTHVGFGYDLHQRDTRPVQIDQRFARIHVMD